MHRRHSTKVGSLGRWGLGLWLAGPAAAWFEQRPADPLEAAAGAAAPIQVASM